MLVLLGALSAFPPMATDAYLPALPTIARELNASASLAPLTVSSFFIGMGAGQLFYGPLSDRIGRIVPLLAGIVLFVAACIGAVFATSVEALIALRLLQGLAGCSGVVIGRAIVRDKYEPAETAQIYSMLMLVLGLAPILAPSIGSTILLFAEWRAIFWMLAIFGAVCGIASFLALTETRSAATAHQARLESPFKSYGVLLRNRRILGYTLCGALTQAALFTYITNSPNLMTQVYGLSPQEFGWMFGINGIGLVLGNEINRRLLGRYSYDQILSYGNWFGVAVAVLLLTAAVTGFGGLYGILVPLFLFVTQMGFSIANAMAGAMAIDPLRAGSASALIGGAQFGVGAIAGAIASMLYDGTAVPMAGVMLLAILLAGLFLRALVKPDAGGQE